MQALTEFAPILAFFVAYYLRGLYVGTAVLMVAMVILLAVTGCAPAASRRCTRSRPYWW